jgi:hypothetical protein
MLTVTTTDQAPEVLPPTVSTPDPRLLDDEAGVPAMGYTRPAEMLTHRAAEMREAGR